MVPKLGWDIAAREAGDVHGRLIHELDPLVSNSLTIFLDSRGQNQVGLTSSSLMITHAGGFLDGSSSGATLRKARPWSIDSSALRAPSFLTGWFRSTGFSSSQALARIFPRSSTSRCRCWVWSFESEWTGGVSMRTPLLQSACLG